MPEFDPIQFGIAGIILAMLVWQLKVSAAERRAMRNESQEQVNKFAASFDRNTEALQKHSEVLAGFQETIRKCEK